MQPPGEIGPYSAALLKLALTRQCCRFATLWQIIYCATDSYLVIGKFKYWVIENVMNRAAPISNAEVRKRGLKYLGRHGKKIGPWGRLISVKKKRSRK